MSETSDLHIMLGEIRGQLREMIHTTNNTSTKVDALTREVIEIKGIATTVAAMELRLKAVEDDVDSLKTDKNRRAGAVSLGEWMFKTAPWLIGGASFAFVAKLIGLGT